MDSASNHHRIAIILLAVIAIVSFSGIGAALPADASPASAPDGSVLQVGDDGPVEIETDDEDSGDGEDDEDGEDSEEDQDEDDIEIVTIGEDEDDEGDEEDEDGDGSSLTPEQQEELEELPIDVDEDDIDPDEIESDDEPGTGVDADEDDGATEQVGTGGPGPSLSPTDNAEQLAEWFAEQMFVATEVLIDDVFNNMLGTPTPENDGWQGILGQPTGETYSELYENVYMDMILPPVFQFMILAFIGFSLFVVPFSPITGQRVWRVMITMFGAAALILLAWNFASLLHHVSDAVTQWFLPQSDEFLGESGVAEDAGLELASGPLAVLLGVYFASWNVGIGLLLIHGIRQVALFFMPTVLPIILVGMYFGPKTSKSAFSVLFWQYIGLLVMNWPTALLLSIAYYVSFDFGMGAAGVLPDMATTIGLFLFAVGIPLLVQTSFLGGSLVAILTKGSVLAAGASTARRYFPTGAIGGAGSSIRRGGGYINPVSRYNRDAASDHERQRRRRDVASSASSTTRTRTPRHGRTLADGGYATRSRSNVGSRYRSPPVRSASQSKTSGSSTSNSAPTGSTHDAGSADARRRERYRRLRGGDGDSS